MVPCLVASVAALLFCSTPSTQAETWNVSTSGTWNSAANWNPASIPNAPGANATFNNAASGSNPAQTANSPVTLDGSKTVGSINFNNDAVNAFTYTISTGTGGPLVFEQTGAGPATITVNSISGATGNNTISVATILTNSLVATVNNVTASSSAGALNLTTAMSGPGGFTKAEDGLSSFGTGAKTYTGATVLNGGRMRMSSTAQPSATSSFTINAGGQLTLINGAGGGTYTFGSGPLNLNGTGAISGPFATSAGAIRNDRGVGSITIRNAVVLQSDTLIHVQALTGTGASATPGATNTLAGNISGTGRLIFTAPGSDIDQGFLILNGHNTYTGGTLVRGGILVASGASASFGAGDVTVDNAEAPSAIARLQIESGVLNGIADATTLSLAGGGTAGVADQGYAILGAGVNEVVGALVLAGVSQALGTYGSTASTATFKKDEFFAGTGIVTVAVTLTVKLDGANAVLSWPTSATGLTLQELDAFPTTPPPFPWTDVTTPVVVLGNNNTVTVPASSGNKFFRLRQ